MWQKCFKDKIKIEKMRNNSLKNKRFTFSDLTFCKVKTMNEIKVTNEALKEI